MDPKSKRYIPNMNKDNNKKGGLIIPTRPYGGASPSHPAGGPTGEFSPQWGWYTAATLTPPEHNMYTKSKKVSAEGSAQMPSIIPKGDANFVFQTLNSKAPAVGWTSVPI